MKNKNKGTTLVELIAVMAIMVIVSSVVYLLFSNSSKVLDKTKRQSHLQDELRMTSSVMENDIRTGTNITVTYPADKNKVVFQSVEYNVKTLMGYTDEVEVVYAFTKGTELYAYALVGPSTGKREIKKIRCDSPATEISTLSKNVKSFALDMTINPFKLSMEVEDAMGVNEKLITRVAARNE